MNTWCPAGTRVTTPQIHGESIETVTTCVPFRWSELILVTLDGLPGFWELKRLTATAVVS